MVMMVMLIMWDSVGNMDKHIRTSYVTEFAVHDYTR